MLKQSPCTFHTGMARPIALPCQPYVARMTSRGGRALKVCPDVFTSASELLRDIMTHVLVEGRYEPTPFS